MTVNHRDKKLDSLLNSRVVIMWKDVRRGDAESVGQLFWGDNVSGAKRGMYFLATDDGSGISFRKSHIRSVFKLTRDTSNVTI